ncbi:MAG TPA: Gfo/Idh/MocA family oxidoreductase, partial [Thermomicrobiales bacterium]|nr:Gfo/Idh/MocA family oxidoreductase [Thermomicrobiales bacterium]
MAETLGVGIVGLGRIGWFHAQQLRGGIAGARLVVAAVDPDHRRRLLASGEAPCPLVDDVAALLALPAVEAVVIASPSSLHEAHIALAAAAGKPIFAEKPLADSVAGARRAAESVRAAAVPFQIGFQRRFDPAYRR